MNGGRLTQYYIFHQDIFFSNIFPTDFINSTLIIGKLGYVNTMIFSAIVECEYISLFIEDRRPQGECRHEGAKACTHARMYKHGGGRPHGTATAAANLIFSNVQCAQMRIIIKIYLKDYKMKTTIYHEYNLALCP